MTWTIPNILSILRLLAAPAIAVVFLLFPHPASDWAAIVIFVVASLTDFVDGWVARKFNQMSRFGAMIDPIADKAMVVTAIAVLAMNFGANFWIIFPASFILLRETFVSGLREFLGTTAGLLKVTKLAKWKTTAQMVSIAVLLAHGIFVHSQGHGSAGMAMTYWLGILLLWVAAALTVITGADYLRKAMPFLKEDSRD